LRQSTPQLFPVADNKGGGEGCCITAPAPPLRRCSLNTAMWRSVSRGLAVRASSGRVLYPPLRSLHRHHASTRYAEVPIPFKPISRNILSSTEPPITCWMCWGSSGLKSALLLGTTGVGKSAVGNAWVDHIVPGTSPPFVESGGTKAGTLVSGAWGSHTGQM
jgi:hypothetical protein